MKRIGIFGGTFDPPHIGHLILAAEAYDQLHLDTILWVLTPTPPHKGGWEISPVERRLELVHAAIAENPAFEICRVDLDREGPHYAVDSVEILRKEYLDSELIYLIGGDSLHDLPIWYQPERLISQVNGLGVMRRPGDQIDLATLEQVLPGITQKVQFIMAPLVEISARRIRERIAEGKMYRYYLPKDVFSIISERGWYRVDDGF